MSHGIHEHRSEVIHARAEDGAGVTIVLHGLGRSSLLDFWPPLGLTIVDHVTEPSLELAVLDAGAGAEATVNGRTGAGGWDRIESELALFTATHLSHLVAVHAGLVRLGGRALLLPGRSRAGKSTLCLAAHRAGAEVLTDEFALVDPRSGATAGWRRPLRIRAATSALERHHVTVTHQPTAVGVVALLEHEPEGVDSWVSITSSEAVLGILANTVCARTRPEDSLDAALAIARSADAVAGTRGEGAESIGPLLALLTSTG